MTLEQAQKITDDWIKTVGVRYFNELTNMAMLTEEVGEVARIIARRYGEQSEKESDKNKDLGDELADVLWVLICLANQTGVNLTEAFEKNLEKKNIRDATRHLENEKLKWLWMGQKENQPFIYSFTGTKIPNSETDSLIFLSGSKPAETGLSPITESTSAWVSLS